MKKFFGILLAAVSALVLLPGCGGGGEDSEGVVTVSQFVNGTKTFVLGAGYMNIYVTGNGVDTNSADGPMTNDYATNVITYVGVGYKAVGSGGDRARADYTVNKTTDAEGNEEITSATLILSFENCSNQELREYFNFPTNNNDDDNPVAGEGGDNDDNTWNGTLTITIDFTTKSWGDGVKTDFKFFLIH